MMGPIIPTMRFDLIRFSLMALLSLAAGGSRPANAQAHAAKAGQDTSAPSSGAVTRGKYIVDNLVICARCHTPLDANGERDTGRWLHGAPVQIEPTYHPAHWALRAPRLAGGPPMTDNEFIKLMTTGIAPTGTYLNLPMIQVRIDARRCAGRSRVSQIASLKFLGREVQLELIDVTPAPVLARFVRPA